MNQIPPAMTVVDAWNAVKPGESLPSGDPRYVNYVNCTEVRDDGDVVCEMAGPRGCSSTLVQQLIDAGLS
jgi:hypothetical protein